MVLLVAPVVTTAGETIGVLAVADPPGPTAELAGATAQLRALLAERTDGVLSASALQERMMAKPSPGMLQDLDRAYAGAVGRYDSADFEGGAQALGAVIADLEKLPEDPQIFAQWTRAMLRLARVEHALGRHGDLQGVLERLLRAAPDLKVDPAQHPRGFIKTVDEVRTRIRSLPTHRLTIAGQAGARIFVDGRAAGTAPLALDLPSGSYRVAAARGGARVPPVSVDVTREDRTVQVDLTVAEALQPLSGPGLALEDAGRAEKVFAASTLLVIDRAVVASFVELSGAKFLVATSYDVRRSRIDREGRVPCLGPGVPFGDLSALATFLLTGRASSLVTVTVPVSLLVAKAAAEPLRVVPPDPTAKVDERRSPALGWTAVGLGAATVVLAGVSISYGVKSEHIYNDAKAMLAPSGTVQPPHTAGEYNARVDDWSHARSVAIGTGAAAGATLVATGVIGYLSYRWTGGVGPFRF